MAWLGHLMRLWLEVDVVFVLVALIATYGKPDKPVTEAEWREFQEAMRKQGFRK